MLFRSIRTALTVLTVSAILIVGFSVLAFSVIQYENLYRETIESDLYGLSGNMAEDLVALMAGEPDPFELAILLSRLDRYANVKYAKIFDSGYALLQHYYGREVTRHGQIRSLDREIDLESALKLADHARVARSLGREVDIESARIGMSNTKSELLALRLIGDERFPLGYLLVVYDIRGPLDKTRQALLSSTAPLTLLVVALSIAVIFFLHYKIMSPLTRLSQFARRVERTKDYSLRIDVKGRDEVATLGHNINRMMSTINTETDKNRKQTRQLLDQRKTMERLANVDSLTGLPNRQFFTEYLRIQLTRAKRSTRNVALIFFDLDGFKGVNDRFGHETGDLLLTEVSKRVKGYIREGDLLSRWGGDEFLILLHDDPDEFTLVTIANRIIEGLREPFHINNWEINISASVGIVNGRNSDHSLSELVSNADVAMYRSKMAGRGTYTIFAREMMEDIKRKLLIASSITSAIKDDEFELVYQGKVSPQESLIGFEALLRWRHPKLGPVSPGEFIPIAEQSGKITDVTRWVLERLCRDLPRIHQIAGKKRPVSVNLSALDLKKPGLLEFIEGLLDTYQIDPAWLEFEVTESAYLENFDVANRFFQAISKMGCSLALDDFGVGYSSLSYLTRIRIDTLKIDKQFVDNIDSSDEDIVVTKAIIDMAKHLHLNICAEGIETRKQFDFLVENGCNQLQGYLFFKPTRLQDLAARPSIKLAGKS